MRLLRWMTAVVVVLGIVYGGYWYVGAGLVNRGLTGWFAQLRDDGWTVDYSDLAVHGFPSRFDVALTAPRIRDPLSGVGWQAPFFHLDALSYRPQHYIAVWPNTQSLTTPLGDVTVGSNRMRANVDFLTGPSFTLDRIIAVIDRLKVTAPTGNWQARSFRFATRRSTGATRAYDVGIETSGLVLSGPLRGSIDPAGRLPATIDDARLDATVSFDAPWDRSALEGVRPQPTAVDLHSLSLHWGPISGRLHGKLAVHDGLADGKLDLDLTGWHRAIDMAMQAGLLPANMRGLIEGGLGLMAGVPGDPDRLKTTVTIRDGQMSLGPIPLGPAPLLVIR